MKKTPPLETTLDLSKGFGFGLLYDPMIGQTQPLHFPFVIRFPKRRFLAGSLKKHL